MVHSTEEERVYGETRSSAIQGLAYVFSRPLRRYSTDDLADVTRLAREARSAGTDAFDMSWQGPSDRRLDTIVICPRLVRRVVAP